MGITDFPLQRKAWSTVLHMHNHALSIILPFLAAGHVHNCTSKAESVNNV